MSFKTLPYPSIPYRNNKLLAIDNSINIYYGTYQNNQDINITTFTKLVQPISSDGILSKDIDINFYFYLLFFQHLDRLLFQKFFLFLINVALKFHHQLQEQL